MQEKYDLKLHEAKEEIEARIQREYDEKLEKEKVEIAAECL